MDRAALKEGLERKIVHLSDGTGISVEDAVNSALEVDVLVFSFRTNDGLFYSGEVDMAAEPDEDLFSGLAGYAEEALNGYRYRQEGKR